MALPITSLTASADDFTVDGIEYTITSSTEGNRTCWVASYNTVSTTSISIPSTVTYSESEYTVTGIAYDAFNKCSSLTSVTIPATVETIQWDVFTDCTSLETITVDSNNQYYYIENGVLYSKSGIVVCCPAKKTGEITIPDGMKEIEEGAFWGCTELTSVKLPESLTTIWGYTFYNCSGLTSMKIPESVTSIEAWAFFGCSNLTSINIPAAVTSISNGMLNRCSKLTSVTIPEAVTSIGRAAFYNCTGLTSITIPAAVTSIGRAAFEGCTGLTSITCNATTPPTLATTPTFNNPAFYGLSCKVYVPSSAYYTYKNDEWGDLSDFRAMLTTGAMGWATCCLDYDVTVPEGTKAYYVSNVADGTATLTELTTVPAGNGFIFNGAEGTFNLEKDDETAETITNKLVGTTEETTVTASSVYTLGKIDDSTVGLLTYTGTTIPACKAYLPKETSNGAKAIRFSFGGSTTSISSAVKDSVNDDIVYNLQGQRVKNMRSGEIYIKNGKKILFK